MIIGDDNFDFVVIMRGDVKSNIENGAWDKVDDFGSDSSDDHCCSEPFSLPMRKKIVVDIDLVAAAVAFAHVER